MPFYDHLCSDHNVCFFICKLRQNLLMSAFVFCGIHIHPKNPCLRKLALHYLFNLLCSCAETSDMRGAAGRAFFCNRFFVATVVAHHFPIIVRCQ